MTKGLSSGTCGSGVLGEAGPGSGQDIGWMLRSCMMRFAFALVGLFLNGLGVVGFRGEAATPWSERTCAASERGFGAT